MTRDDECAVTHHSDCVDGDAYGPALCICGYWKRKEFFRRARADGLSRKEALLCAEEFWRASRSEEGRHE